MPHLLYTGTWKNYKAMVEHLNKMQTDLVREFEETIKRYEETCRIYESASGDADAADMVALDALFIQFSEDYSRFLETHAKSSIDLEQLESKLSERTVRTEHLNFVLQRLECLFLSYFKFERTFKSLNSSFRICTSLIPLLSDGAEP